MLDPEGNEPPYDGFAELYFESQAAMEVALATQQGECLFADIPNFCQMDKTLGIAVVEAK